MKQCPLTQLPTIIGDLALPSSGSSGKVSGAWVFRGTRVPVHALFENLMAGASVNDFLEWFPGVERWQVEAVLEHESRALVNSRL